MEKLYVNEIRPDGSVSTVGLFYSRAEAEHIVAQLKGIPKKADLRYEIVAVPATAFATGPRQRVHTTGKE